MILLATKNCSLRRGPTLLHALLAPSVAHSFVTLEDQRFVQYQIGGDYVPDAARGIRWDGPSFDIGWPMSPLVISDRDRNYEDYRL